MYHVTPEDCKPFIAELENLQRYRYDMRTVFRDWVAMTFCSFRNLLNLDGPETWERVEAQYMGLVRKYFPHDPAEVPDMQDERRAALNGLCGLTGRMMEFRRGKGRYVDLLGPLFMAADTASASAGQYFTPPAVAELMVSMTCGEDQREGIISVSEPAAGAGVLVLAYAAALDRGGRDPLLSMVAHCTDVEVTAFQMCYIQMVLADIPAIVVHGNTLSMETWDCVATNPLAIRWERGEFNPADEIPPAPDLVAVPEPAGQGQQSLF